MAKAHRLALAPIRMPAIRPVRLPEIHTARCTGCGWCVAACPLNLLSLEPRGWKKKSVLGDASACTGCSLCAARCPFNAITMVKKKPPGNAGGS